MSKQWLDISRTSGYNPKEIGKKLDATILTFEDALTDLDQELNNVGQELNNVANKADGIGLDLDTLINSLGNLAYKNLVEKAMLGETVIQGGYLVTDLIRAGAINAQKLLIGNWDNLIENPTFENGLEGWTGAGTLNTDNTRTYIGDYCMMFTKSTEAKGARTEKLYDVIPGERYYFEFYASAGGNVRPQVRPVVQAFKTDGTYQWITGTYVQPPFVWNGWTKCSFSFTIPADVKQIRFCAFATELDDGVIYLDAFYAKKMLTGDVIVDGSVHAQKIVAKSITDGQLALGAVSGYYRDDWNGVTYTNYNYFQAGEARVVHNENPKHYRINLPRAYSSVSYGIFVTSNDSRINIAYTNESTNGFDIVLRNVVGSSAIGDTEGIRWYTFGRV